MSFVAPAIMLLGAMIVAFGVTSSAATGSLEPQVDAFQAAAERTAELNRTRLDASGVTHGEPDFVTDPDFYVTIRNDGTTILRDVSRWDVFADYQEADGTHHTLRLTHTTTATPSADQWSSQGIYSDASALTAETHQPGILNPGEEILLRFRLSATPANPESNLVRVAVPNGASVLAGFTWRAATSTPDLVRNGGALTSAGGVVWGVRGRDDDDFWSYDIDADTWTVLPVFPFGIGNGGGIAYAEVSGSRYVYAMAGGNTWEFQRYDIDGGAWELRTDTPAKVQDGGALTWDGGSYLYGLRGNNQTDFWRYDLAADSWSALTDAPGSLDSGSALVHLDGYVYTIRGTGADDFWRWNVADQTW